MHRLITIVGPDGAGKTAVTDRLQARLGELGPVARFHHRLRALPGRAGSTVATETPHDQVPYGRALSLAKVVFLWGDWMVSWPLRARPTLRRDGWVLLERGWWDLAVDPLRYRLRPAPRLVALLGRLGPGRGLTVVLDGPAEVLHARKPELTLPELGRQLAAWRAVAARAPSVVVSVDQDIEAVVADVMAAIGAGPTPSGAAPGPDRERGVTRRRFASQAIWGLADQAFSSVTNFALSIVVARNVTAEGFGAFTLAFATYTILLTVVRALTSEPLTMRFSVADHQAWRAATASATGLSFAVGAVSGAVVAVVGLVLGGSTGTGLVVLGVGLPFLLLQDAWRFAFFAVGRGRAAMVNDLVWAIVLFALLAGATRVGLNPTSAILVWALGAAAAAVFGIAQARTMPDPRRPLQWWRDHRDLIPRLTAEAVVLSGVRPLSLFAVGGVAGLAAAGTLRAAQVLMNGLNILSQGMRLSAVPMATRIAHDTRDRLVGFCGLLGSGLAAAALVWTTLLLLMPDSWGEAILGSTWDGARTVILPVGLTTAAGAFQAGGQVGLRALAATSHSLRARSVSATAMLAGGMLGAVVSGATGAAWGLAPRLGAGGRRVVAAARARPPHPHPRRRPAPGLSRRARSAGGVARVVDLVVGLHAGEPSGAVGGHGAPREHRLEQGAAGLHPPEPQPHGHRIGLPEAAGEAPGLDPQHGRPVPAPGSDRGGRLAHGRRPPAEQRRAELDALRVGVEQLHDPLDP